MDLFNAIHPLYVVSRCLATVPFIPNRNPINSPTNRILNIVHYVWTVVIIGILITGLKMYIENYHIRLTGNPGQLMSRIFSSPANFINSIVDIAFMATINRKSILTLLNRMYNIDTIFLLRNHEGMYKKTRRYLVIQIIVLSLLLLPFIFCDVYFFGTLSSYCYEIINKLSISVSLVSVLQYVNLMKYLKDRLLILNEYISANFANFYDCDPMTNRKFHSWQLVKRYNSVTCEMKSRTFIPYNRREISENIFKQRIYYNEIFEASRIVNSVYGINILLTLFYCFISVVTNSYFFFMDTFQNYDMLQTTLPGVDYHIVTHIFWVSFAIAKAAAISVSCQLVIEEMNTASCNLQKLQLSQHLNKDILHNLEKFSRQIACNEIQFTALGFFSVNLSFLYAFIASSVTYVIVLIQFNYKS
ncbi:hypothetical protein L9F63_023063 [Diploptera punctata]|uniref:Gustatory receptor n=1 Tax=Diploptera punctata TaxID=6984 RepID=A0AAD7ZKU8_DIPPU|nr:hypothetical protein L9F63_023063 [Diploptera punctata]